MMDEHVADQEPLPVAGDLAADANMGVQGWEPHMGSVS